MRTILTLLATILPAFAFAADAYDPDAFGQEPPSADTASEIYTLCGETYAMALPAASIGYLITSKLNNGVLTFQVVESGLEEKPLLRIKQSASAALTKAATKGELFAVFEPIKGSTETAKVTIHGKTAEGCKPLIAPQTIQGANTFPELVKMMINEPWNRK